MSAPTETESSSARAWAGCALVVLGTAWLIVGLLAFDTLRRDALALAVVPAVVLVAAGALVSRSGAA